MVFIKSLSIIMISMLLSLESVQPGQSLPAQTTGKEVVNALRRSAPEDFISLAPSLSEIHQLMEDRKSLYGQFLESAQTEFGETYVQEIIPSLRLTYYNLSEELVRRNFDLSKLAFVSAVVGSTDQTAMDGYPLTITLTDGSQVASIHFDQTMMIAGKLKITQRARLL